jgi:phage tail sheath protein FI
MARTINSPGVQITETDLSVTQQFGGATTVFLAGYASQGPTDEVLQISSVSELEQVFGTPATPAERYFYHSGKEVLNSPANLLITRLPYGSGAGDGFSEQYGALFFPVASSEAGFQIGAPIAKNLTQNQYDSLLQSDFTWSSITTVDASLSSVTAYPGTSSVTATPTTSATVQAQIANIDPSFSISIAGSAVTFTFDTILSSVNYNGGPASYDGTNVNAGIVILNSAQTTINEKFEGYYIALADNTGYGANSDFTAVKKFYSLSATDSFYEVSTTRLGFSLSSTKEQVGSNSMSEALEFVPTFNFNDSYYRDSLVLGIFKVRNSIYEPQTLTYSLVEAHIGSLDAQKRTVAAIGGTPKSFFLQDIVDNASSNVKVLVHPKIAYTTPWSGLSSNSPSKSVTVNTNANASYPVGAYVPSYLVSENKQIGETVTKLSRALTLIETPETVFVDVIADAGLSTIHAYTSGGSFNDAKDITEADLTSVSSDLVTRWRSVFNTYNGFVQNTRKDCVFISDPLRANFLRGDNTKVLSIRNKNFSQHVYQPLRTQFESINTNYSVTYGNWVRGYDQFLDKGVWLPSSGFAAAVYARSDAATQPWFAPAGFTRGTINNITDLAFNPNQKQRDFLYTVSINPIAMFSGDGFVVFGQKTLQSKPSAFDRVNVRRLFLTLERAVQRTLKYYVFEPNTEFTRTRLRSSISPVFDLAKNTQGLYDYLIVCDERNNTPDLVDRNELAVDIYIKPTRAAEFILVNFIATRTNQNFLELI